jgi:RND family efflux transporter MFP subunit
MLSRKILLVVAIIGLTFTVIGILQTFRPEAQTRPPSVESALSIEAQTVTSSTYQVQLPSRGLVGAQTHSTLAAEVAGSVVAVADAFRKGARFQRGDWLLSIDSRDYEAALKLAEANLRRTQLNLEQEAALADQAARDWQRLGNKKAAPQLVLREPQVEAAKADLASAQAQLDIAELDLSRTKINAPFNGRVIDQLADVGQYLNPGAQIAEIQGSDILEVELPISSQWRGFLPEQLETAIATLKLSFATETIEWTARIVRQSAGIDLQTRQFTLIAQIEQAPSDRATLHSLQVGDFVEARVLGKKLQKVFVLPRQALVEGIYVWRVENNRIFKREVNVLWLDEDEVVIDKGLSAGDIINTTPLSYAISGTQVKVLSASLAAQQSEKKSATPVGEAQ